MNNNSISVIGSGTMGNGIAHVFSMSKNINNVVLIDLDKEILENAKKNIEANLERQVKKNIISNEDAIHSLNKIKLSTDINSIKMSQLIIEAIKEDVKLKKNIFNKIDNLVDSNSIMASNTSSISINEIASATNNPENVIGMHFMNPVPIMKLVEVIRGLKTSDAVVNKTIEYIEDLKKIPVQCNDSPGFVSNRILMPMINEAAYTYMEGVASVDGIDQIMKLGMGHPMGPLKLADLIGIDVCVYIMDVLYKGLNNTKYRVCPILTEMVKNNKLGVKTKEGFYKY
tara:strand:- start:706 stop:1560 length:855 start_codon:yes stop_codon:yes gene_type:complete